MDSSRLAGPGGPVRISFDPRDRPTVEAASRDGAAFGLGWAVARHRHRQMDVLRRRSHGRLAAVAGARALGGDIRQRRLGLDRVAERCWAGLPPDQRRLAEVFAAGANTSAPHLQWSPVDSIAVAQLMYQSMASDGSDARMVEVMRRTLPGEVVDFLLSPDDPFETGVDGSTPDRPPSPMPSKAVRRLLAEPGDAPSRVVVADGRPVGSNAWAVSFGGSAMLANDMHLELTSPSVWYAARLVAGGREVAGVTLPGLPLIVAGCNGSVAWGFTRLAADTTDLAEVPPGGHPVRRETIAVAGAPDVTIEVAVSKHGPVTSELAGRHVAFDSPLLDPGTIDFELEAVHRADTVAEAVAIVTRSGLPPLNAVLAGDDGTVAWTVAGRFRPRQGRGPRGFSASGDAPPPLGQAIPPWRLPRVIAPASGVVVSCNNGNAAVREAGLAWNLFSGARARRASTLLAGGAGRDEAGALCMQLDADAAFFGYYRDLALLHLPERPSGRLGALRAEVTAWNGTAGCDEVGLALLVAFRDLLREALFAALTRPCWRYDPEFTYCYNGHEGPLRRLIEALDDEFVPAPWPTARRFVLGQLLLARLLLTEQTGSPGPVRWGAFNRLALRVLDPAEAPDPGLDGLELAGCAESLCVSQPGFGASMRLVIDPANRHRALMSIPGSPSGMAPSNAAHVRCWAAGQAHALPGGTLHPVGA